MHWIQNLIINKKIHRFSFQINVVDSSLYFSSQFLPGPSPKAETWILIFRHLISIYQSKNRSPHQL